MNKKQLLEEIKILKLAIATANKMIQTYMNAYWLDSPKYKKKILDKHKQIIGWEQLINQFRHKILQMGFKKLK